MKFYQMSWNIIHAPKWQERSTKLSNINIGRTSRTSFKFHIRPNCDVELFKCLHKKILHSSFNFHFGLVVNISSKHYSIPLQNSWMWKITQHTIDVENQQFFKPKSGEQWCEHIEMLWWLHFARKKHWTKTTKYVSEMEYIFIKE